MFFGRTDEQGEDRTFQIACASGREDKDENTEGIFIFADFLDR